MICALRERGVLNVDPISRGLKPQGGIVEKRRVIPVLNVDPISRGLKRIGAGYTRSLLCYQTT